jgi:hypothetical protein
VKFSNEIQAVVPASNAHSGTTGYYPNRLRWNLLQRDHIQHEWTEQGPRSKAVNNRPIYLKDAVGNFATSSRRASAAGLLC